MEEGSSAPCTDCTSAESAQTSPNQTTVDEDCSQGNNAHVSSHTHTYEHGSSVGGAIFNFTNCIIGAGAIGLGGAFALSGGLISIASILFFGVLTKLSLDLVVSMSIEFGGSYEELGKAALGHVGWVAVLVSKFLYSFGCLVAYIVVVKDNMSVALLHLLYGDDASDNTSWFAHLLERTDLDTLLLSALVILPLCLLRDMSSLANLSAVSVVSMVFIVVIIIYLYLDNPGGNIRESGGTPYENWIEIRPGYIESLGTFVFTFVSQHTVHLTYESIKIDARNLKNWRIVSSWAIGIATTVSLTVGVTVYITFWQHAGSDLFEMYPPLHAIDLAKMLLCLTMLLTFPLPFFTCRELIIVSLTHCGEQREQVVAATNTETAIDDEVNSSSLQEPLLSDDQEGGHNTTSPRMSPARSSRILLNGEEKQLILSLHVAVTVSLWILTTLLAILAPSLGDVLDLVGCGTGTVIAFILPGLFSFRLQGYTHLAAFILAVGGLVGLVGTTFSLQKLVADL